MRLIFELANKCFTWIPYLSAVFRFLYEILNALLCSSITVVNLSKTTLNNFYIGRIVLGNRDSIWLTKRALINIFLKIVSCTFYMKLRVIACRIQMQLWHILPDGLLLLRWKGLIICRYFYIAAVTLQNIKNISENIVKWTG